MVISNIKIFEENLEKYIKKICNLGLIGSNNKLRIKEDLIDIFNKIINDGYNIEILKHCPQDLLFFLEYFIKDLLSEQNINLNDILKSKLEEANLLLEKRDIIDLDYDLRVKLHKEEQLIDEYFETRDSGRKRRIDFIINNISPKENETIINIGCGVGSTAFHCAKKGAICYAIDYSLKSMEVGKEIVNKYDTKGRINFLQWQVDDPLPFKDNSFDKLVTADFIEHITYEQKNKLFPEILRVTKPGGMIVILTPNKIREDIGAIKRKILRLFKKNIPETRLHFGLTNKFEFNKIIRKENKIIKTINIIFFDPDRPYLSKIPIIKEILSLNVVWKIQKGGK